MRYVAVITQGEGVKSPRRISLSPNALPVYTFRP
jgi:hypothetical protein